MHAPQAWPSDSAHPFLLLRLIAQISLEGSLQAKVFGIGPSLALPDNGARGRWQPIERHYILNGKVDERF